ncbi:MAG TPA: alcohol dehydrogenase catalytic domain-containing protein [Fimbriimonadaceae bacterium]|nr:alcohol dehydrogenase catalytic domain-containing protein [Fimbriimonadaceae bacterium]
MRLARYLGGGIVEIGDEPAPLCPPGGLLVRTEACGLCSGELMDWYLDRKVPHVLGHEVAGIVVESEDDRFPVGARVFPHHHAPCGTCPDCLAGRTVHCRQWKSTRLNPGGMAERFAVAAENLADTWVAGDLRAIDAALIEPLACVEKSLRKAAVHPHDRVAVIGLGVMGLMHLLCLRARLAVPEAQSVGFDLLDTRRDWATRLGLSASAPGPVTGAFDVVVVCPGSAAALRSALELAAPEARVVLFAPLPPSSPVSLDFEALYFREVQLLPSYSCGPADTEAAIGSLRRGILRAEDVVSDFIELDRLPDAYGAMKRGEILKAMVVFP